MISKRGASRAEELIQRRAQTGEICAGRQPVVTSLDKGDRDVRAPEALGERFPRLPAGGSPLEPVVPGVAVELLTLDDLSNRTKPV